VVSLIYAGTLRNRPNIKLILSHGGGALPALVQRIAMVSNTPFITPRPQGGAAEVIEEIRRLYFDLALAATPLTFRSLLEITDISHIMYGSDYPFAPPPAIASNNTGFEQILAGLNPDESSMLNAGNAASLFPRLKNV
jgi:predicted TIM-barrel fold metal-dependent hydrolase